MINFFTSCYHQNYTLGPTNFYSGSMDETGYGITIQVTVLKS